MNDQPSPPAAETPSPWWHVFRVFDEPSAVFRSLAQKPRLLAPILALIAVSLVAGFTTPASVLQDQARQQAELMRKRASQMPDEQRQQFEERATNMVAQAATTPRRVSIAVFGSIIPLIAFAIAALVLMLIFGAMGTEPVKFKAEYSIVLHAFVPQLLGILLVLGLGIGGMSNVQLSLGFLSDIEQSPFMFTLLSQFGLFALWNVYLLALGNQVLTGAKGIGGAIAVVGGLWLLKNVAIAGLVGFFAGLAG